MTSDERFLSPQEIAGRLQITDRAVLDMIEAGKLTGVRVGATGDKPGRGRGVWRVSEASYVAYLQTQRGGDEELPM